MRCLPPFLALSIAHLAVTEGGAEATAGSPGNLVILDEAAVKNLRLETAEMEERTFEETVFALGHIEVLPGRRAIVSSRIAGRAMSVLALPDQMVDEGNELVWVESRQPGDPPPAVMLAAPMTGLIAKVDVMTGQPISPDQGLIEIIDIETVEGAAQVPEHLAGRLAKDQMARIRLPAFPGKIMEAKLAHLGAYADEQSGTIEAAFHIKNEDLSLRPGLRAEFTILVANRENVAAVPRAAVQGDALNRFVFVKDFDLPNAFAKAPVVIGAENDLYSEVISGLLPGDEVVTQGGYALAHAGGGTVSLKEALDAAHGHEHNPDGSEQTERKEAVGDTHGHDTGAGHPMWNGLTILFAGSTMLLLLLLGWVSWKHKLTEA